MRQAGILAAANQKIPRPPTRIYPRNQFWPHRPLLRRRIIGFGRGANCSELASLVGSGAARLVQMCMHVPQLSNP